MKALLVICMQEVCVGKDHASFFKYDQGLLNRVNQIIDINHNNLVVYIRNVMKKNLINSFTPFNAYEGSKEVELVDGLHIISEYCIDKYETNAFSNDALSELLHEKQVNELEIVGIDGAGCVALTAMGGIKAGFKVLLNNDGIGTMDLKRKKKYDKKLRKLGASFISCN